MKFFCPESCLMDNFSIPAKPEFDFSLRLLLAAFLYSPSWRRFVSPFRASLATSFHLPTPGALCRAKFIRTEMAPSAGLTGGKGSLLPRGSAPAVDGHELYFDGDETRSSR